MNKFVQFVLNRLGEQSTYNGLTLLCTLAGIAISPEQTHAIAALGAGIVGIIATFFPDHSKAKVAQDFVNIHSSVVATVLQDIAKRGQSSDSVNPQGSGTSREETARVPNLFV
jgi:hypothetical protein